MRYFTSTTIRTVRTSICIGFFCTIFLYSQVHAGTLIQVAPNSDLIAYWSFDTNTINWTSNTVNDISSNANNGTAVSMDVSNQVNGKRGQGLHFDGNVESVSLASNPVSPVANANSACAWAKTEDITVAPGAWDQTFLNLYTDVNNGIRIGNVTNSGYFFAAYRVGGVDYGGQTTAVAFTNNTWAHVCYVWNGVSAGITLYINGAAVASSTNTNSPGAASVIGARNNDGDATWYGTVDDLRIFSRALTASEIRQIYMSGALVLAKRPTMVATVAATSRYAVTSNLVGHWTFDGNKTNWATNQVTDSSGQGNTGTMSGMSTSTSPVMGKIGQALFFDGSNDYVNAGSASSLDDISQQGGGGMTISLWVKPTSLNTLITKGGSSSGFWRLVTASGNKLQFEKHGSVNMVARTEANAYVDNAWNHIVVFTDYGASGIASNVLFYVNGVLKSHDLDTNGFNIGTDQNHNLTIGAYADASQASNAVFDDVRLYNRQLSAQEIRQLYLLGK